MIDLAQPAEPAVDVILRDGTTLRLRPPTEADVRGVMAFFADLSVRSRFLRFHGFTVAGDRFVRSFVEPDWAERGSLIGVMGDAADERVVGVGNYVRLRDPQSAEAAFAVADEFQGKGIGTRLLEQLAQRAAATASRRSSPRSCPRTTRCSPCSRTPASCRRARSKAA